MKLADKVAIITGGSKGIGLGCARVFGKHGAKVVIAARGEQAGKAAEGDLREVNIDALFVACDVSDETRMRALIDRTIEHFGQIDCIVNNAGWHPPALTIDQIDVEDFEKLLRLNLTSTFMGCKFSLPHLLETKGSIINMTSAVALIGQTAAASYVATKGGQIGLTRALAADLAEKMLQLRLAIDKVEDVFYKLGDLDRNDENHDHMVGGWLKQNQQRAGQITGQLGDLVAMTPDEWQFSTDIHNEGIVYRWLDPSFDTSKWRTMRTSRIWEIQGLHDQEGRGYDGVGWYRTTVRVPGQFAGRKINLGFGGVHGKMLIWVNGRFVTYRPFRLPWWKHAYNQKRPYRHGNKRT